MTNNEFSRTDGWAFAKRLSNSLLKVRPLGGSELFVERNGDYYADPEYCGRMIEEMRAELYEARTKKVRSEKSSDPRMDGTIEQKLMWRILALREALSDIKSMKDGVSHQIANNALAVDDGNARLCKPTTTPADNSLTSPDDMGIPE